MNKKIFIVVLALVIVASLVADVYFIFSSGKNVAVGNVAQKTKATDPKNATYIIDGQSVTLANGVSSVPAAPGSAQMVVTRYFGNEVSHDFDGDGRQDVAFLLTQNSSGSGTFYYVVAALNTADGFVGSDGFLLGDRIAPQTTEMSQNPKTPNVIVVNYADRKVGESFAVRPSLGKSVWLMLDTKTMQFGTVEQNFEGESDGSISTVGNLTCKNSPNYFIVSKSLTDSVGSDILVKSKTSQQSLPCAYNVASGDFEIKNVLAEYFLVVTDHFLILDSGTAPDPRGLIVYDLNTHKKIYTDKYSQPFSATLDLLKYWTPVSEKVTNDNCPKLSEYSANGLGAEIEHYVTLNLASMIKKDSGQSRCSAIQ